MSVAWDASQEVADLAIELRVLVAAHSVSLRRLTRLDVQWDTNGHFLADTFQKIILEYCIEREFDISRVRTVVDVLDKRAPFDSQHATGILTGNIFEALDMQYDFVFLPDLDGEWWAALNSNDPPAALAQLLMRAMVNVKPGGLLAASKLLSTDRNSLLSYIPRHLFPNFEDFDDHTGGWLLLQQPEV